MSIWRKALNYIARSVNLRTVDGRPRTDSYAGMPVNETSVLALSAAWACVNLLSGTIASLPLMVYRTDASGRRTVAKDHPLYRVLHDSPNADQTAMDFWEGGVAALELRGNMHARIERMGGRVVALVPICDPTVRRLENGDLEYRWTEDGKSYVATQDDVFHVRGFGGSPLGGLSTLSYGRQVFGLSSAVNTAAQKTFANGIHTNVGLKTDKWLTDEQYDAISQNTGARYAGAMNAGRPFISHGGMEIVPLTMNPEDAQMLESRAFSVEEIARLFGVPPHMIGHTEKTTSWGTGLEEQTLGFQKFSLRRRLKRIEQAIEKQLLTPADRAQGITVEFNLEGLLRADSTGRAEFYREMTGIGAMTINEVRALENLPPVEGGDVPRMQMQNVPITEAGKQPALPAPEA
ncbi:phage portal protein [Brevundimonas sp. 2R-24]|uniref:Phage portal protein n=1 Tax=Peiella sedimenti TaxID=3061083 RepID=A0ABT8SP99_9CAUL|nr:phage portal protein [Caulobacteraceae bacterium XZ-24]